MRSLYATSASLLYRIPRALKSWLTGTQGRARCAADWRPNHHNPTVTLTSFLWEKGPARMPVEAPRWQSALRGSPHADTMSNSNGGRRRSLANLGGNMLQSTLAAFVPPKLAHSGSSGEPHAATAQTVTSARPDTAAQTLAAAKPPRPKRPVDSVSGPTGCVWMWCPAAARLKPLPSR